MHDAPSIDIGQLQRALRRVGLRATHTRVAILRELVNVRAPMSFRVFSRHLAASGFDRVTVWRTLSALSKAELAQGGREEIADEDFRAALRSAGFRPSASRVAILRELMSLGVPMTVTALSRHLAAKGFDASTILRNVEPFAEAGLLARDDFDDLPTISRLLCNAFGGLPSRVR
ncbi:MAG: hypothetical protein ABIP39_00205 [Polyangiaceae bacterium]